MIHRGKLLRPVKVTHFPAIRPTYYYVVADSVKGRPFTDGPYNTREEAQKFAWKSLQGVVWRIVESRYRDLLRITNQHRHDVLEKTRNPDEALSRMKHKV